MPVLWVTGLIGLALGGYLGLRGAKKRDLCDICFSIGLLVLGVLSLVLAATGYEALGLAVAPVLGALPPLLMSLGVVYVALPRYWKWYLIFVIVGIVAIAAVRQAVMVFHPVAGLILLALPVYAVIKKVAPPYFSLVSIGALLIGVGGVALATIAAGRPLLPLELVLAILPYVLLGTVVFMGLGALLGRR